MKNLLKEVQPTPLYQAHLNYQARFISFYGWLLPREYESSLKEAYLTRTCCGLFDISHMGEIVIKGEKKNEFLRKMLVNDLSLLEEGEAQYNLFCQEKGGIIDDLILYNQGDSFLCVVNAVNKDKDLAWLKRHSSKNVEIRDISENIVLISLQGPKSKDVLKEVVEENLDKLRYMHFLWGKIEEKRVLISRTGYTGEDGFEIFIDRREDPLFIWEIIMKAGKKHGLFPAGLGARDILRLEAGYPLYGNELSEDIDPLEASLEWVVKNPHNFIGKEAILRKKEVRKEKIGLLRVGFIMQDKGFARPGYEVYSQEEKLIGKVTSGCYSPNLACFIGMAFLPSSYAQENTPLKIKIRGNFYKAEIRKFPFVPIKVCRENKGERRQR